MAPPLLQLRDIALTFGGASLLDGVELSVSPGERVCLVGRNGSGKSTLLKIAAGLIVSDGGTRFIQPDATIRYLPQEPDMSGFTTTLAYAEAGLTDGDAAHSARYLLEQLGLTGEENPATISGGEARRAALAHVLAPDPDILLLDEPTNHLDLPTIEWLEGELRSRKTALVLISHDRRFLQNLSRITVWLDRGKTRRLDVGFGDFEERRDAILAEEERDQHKLDRKIAAEEDWIRYGVTARRKRNVRRLADLQKMRKAQSDYRGPSGKATIAAAESDKSGTLVIEAKGIGKSFGDRTVVKDFSIRVHRGDRLGIVGPNGSGKTTLVNLLAGALSPDSGTIRLGTNLDIATLDQRRESLDPNWTLREAMTGGSGDTVTVGVQTRHVVSYMKDFLFTAEQIRTPLHALSGGERGRLMLARALARPSNLLVLDEPTNDLDLETLDVLEETLGDYAGTVILISHDRDFLDRVVNSVVAPDGSGHWIDYAGGYSDMIAQRGADLAPRAAGRATPKETRDRVADAPKTKRRLNFNEKYALENLPKQMEKLETEIVAFQKKLDDPALYERDRKSFDDTMAKLTAAQAALHAAEEKWLELEMLREEIERA